LRGACEESVRLVWVGLRFVDGVERLLELIRETTRFVKRRQPIFANSLKERNREVAEAIIRAKRLFMTCGGDHELAGVLIVVNVGYRTIQVHHSTERRYLLAERVLHLIHAPNRLEQGGLPQEIDGLIEAGLLPIL